MKSYKLLIEGRNFLLHFEGRTQKMGFYTTVLVQANDYQDAKRKALELVLRHNDLSLQALNPLDDPPEIDVKDTEEIDLAEDIKDQTTGFSFYIED